MGEASDQGATGGTDRRPRQRALLGGTHIRTAREASNKAYSQYLFFLIYLDLI